MSKEENIVWEAWWKSPIRIGKYVFKFGQQYAVLKFHDTSWKFWTSSLEDWSDYSAIRIGRRLYKITSKEPVI